MEARAWLALVQHGEGDHGEALGRLSWDERATLLANLVSAGARGEIGVAAMLASSGAVDADMLADEAACERLRIVATNRLRKKAARAAALELLARKDAVKSWELAKVALEAGDQEPWEVVLAAVEAASCCLESEVDALHNSDNIADSVEKESRRGNDELLKSSRGSLLARLLIRCNVDCQVAAVAKKATKVVVRFHGDDLAQAFATAQASLELAASRLSEAVGALASPELETQHSLIEAFGALVPDLVRAGVTGKQAEILGRSLENLDETLQELEAEGDINILQSLPSLLSGYLQSQRTVSASFVERPALNEESEAAIQGAQVAAWDHEGVSLEVVPRCESREGCARLAKELQNANNFNIELADGQGQGQMVWPYLRNVLASKKWCESEWIACNAMLCLVQRSSRADLRGESAVGHIIPMVLPVVEHAAPSVCIPGLSSLWRLTEMLTTTEFRWHGELVLDRVQEACTTARDADVLAVALPVLLGALAHMERVGGESRMQHHRAALEALLPCAELATEMPVLALVSGKACAPLVDRLQNPCQDTNPVVDKARETLLMVHGLGVALCVDEPEDLAFTFVMDDHRPE
ncbi:Hypothetical Protein FCC1311_096802 [Hondaea fermentalgiana]|uniref:Uncharacterized protein n=1 Tax=Hondaea fermentalgiana TaxID=2315210 RepID=A0A2R5GRF0_9STRA|nr:Hypothetical Protein FCC1311_096802 [Hondaea fermentalgiana]|eukprot:GBG33457.1 Hypothetical Protein FCC1311_096802 [Hondaea fermentalgiana]